LASSRLKRLAPSRLKRLLLDVTPPNRKPPWMKGARVNVAFSPDGERIILAGRHTANCLSGAGVTVLDARTGSAQWELNENKGAVTSLAVSRDGSRFATGSTNKLATVWDTQIGTALVELKGLPSMVDSVSFSSDGTRFFHIQQGRGKKCKTRRSPQWTATSGSAPTDASSPIGTRTAPWWFAWFRIGRRLPPAGCTCSRTCGAIGAGYLAARAARNDFAAAFSLKLLPPDARKELEAIQAANKKPKK
jgi:hypothetical protein